MRYQQKLGLGVLLSLSIVMVIVAIVRVAGVRLQSGDVDIVWLAFWQQQECSIAVSTFAITAFRTLFVQSASNQKRARVVSAYWKNKLLRRKVADESEQQKVDGLPAIPSATLTGMRTMIGESGKLGAYNDLNDSEMMLNA